MGPMMRIAPNDADSKPKARVRSSYRHMNININTNTSTQHNNTSDQAMNNVRYRFCDVSDVGNAYGVGLHAAVQDAANEVYVPKSQNMSN